MMKWYHITAVANTKIRKCEVVQSSQVSLFETFNLDLEVGIACTHLDKQMNTDYDWSQALVQLSWLISSFLTGIDTSSQWFPILSLRASELLPGADV